MGIAVEQARATGWFDARLLDAHGREIWRDHFPNTVVTVGKNLALDTYLAGAAYTVTGPFVGLISSVGFTGIVAGDTMAAHPGWLEAGGANAPTYSGTRDTAAWAAAAAGAKSFSGPAVFNLTGTGTVKGAFIVFGPGALNTIGNGAGTLYSAGLFTGGDLGVVSGVALQVSYTASL